MGKTPVLSAPLPREHASSTAGPGRTPMVPIALALSAGIGSAHWLSAPFELLFGLAASAAVLLLASAPLRNSLCRPLRVAVLLLLFAAIGLLSEQAAWFQRPVDSILRYASDSAKLVRLRGRLVSSPTIDRRREAGQTAAWILEDRSRFILEVEQLLTDPAVATNQSAGVPSSGRVQVQVSGHLLHADSGDRIEMIGWLRTPARPRNPGDFDYARYLRQHGVDAVLFADHPDIVKVIGRARFNLSAFLATQREQLAARFAVTLSEANASTAAAMLLGDRSGLSEDLNDSYANSGAMHLLAISGLHVGILALLISGLTRVLGMRPVPRMLLLLAIIFSYAALTDLRASVLRAAIFITIWNIGNLIGGRRSLLSAAATTAVLLLLWNPLLLFDLGAVLSLLAVLGMEWSREFLGCGMLHDEADPADVALPDDPRLPAFVVRFVRNAVDLQKMGFGIWLFTAPAIATSFELVSPIGLLINLIVIPLATVILWLGYLFLAVAWLLPSLAPFAAVPFDVGLSLLNAIVVAAGDVRMGHFSVGGPPAWWLMLFYAALGGSLLMPWLWNRKIRWINLLLFIAAFGLVIKPANANALESTRSRTLRCTVLAVGHGGATLIETPGGRTLLYDCGSMENDRQAAAAVWRALRQRGHTALDAVILSHADLDHANNLPALLAGGTVRELFLAHSFLDPGQPIVRLVQDAASAAGCEPRRLSAGDALRLDADVRCEVLHPPVRAPNGDDNANSIVLRITYGGRSILLPGDLEGSGQAELIRWQTGGDDVLISPHHGGAKANIASFAAWAQPKVVIVSGRQPDDGPRLTAIYPTARHLFLTARDGSILVALDDQGRCACGPLMNAH